MRILARLLVLLGVLGFSAGSTWYMWDRFQYPLMIIVDGTFGLAARIATDKLMVVLDQQFGPLFEVRRLEYLPPRTLIVHDLRLVDEGTTFVHIPRGTIELERFPRTNEPLLFSTIELDRPRVSILKREDGSILGFDRFTTGDVDEREDDEASAPDFSEILAIRRIGIVNGHFTLDLGKRGPLEIDRLSFDILNDPDSGDPGLYQIDTRVLRKPILDLELAASCDLDASIATVDSLRLEINLGDIAGAGLPDSLQKVIASRGIGGTLFFQCAGTVPLTAVKESDLDFELTQENTTMTFGEFGLDTPLIDLDGSLSQGVLTLDPLIIAVGGGTIAGDARMPLDGRTHGRVNVDASGVRLETFSNLPEGETPSFGGRLDINGHADFVLARPRATLDGELHLEYIDGRLGGDSLIVSLVRQVTGESVFQQESIRGSGDVELHHDRLELSNTVVVTSLAAGTGQGDIFFNGDVDLRCNAGPLERATLAIGIIGDVIRGISDKFVTYRVRGTLDEPEITVHAFGIGAKDRQDR